MDKLIETRDKEAVLNDIWAEMASLNAVFREYDPVFRQAYRHDPSVKSILDNLLDILHRVSSPVPADSNTHGQSAYADKGQWKYVAEELVKEDLAN